VFLELQAMSAHSLSSRFSEHYSRREAIKLAMRGAALGTVPLLSGCDLLQYLVDDSPTYSGSPGTLADNPARVLTPSVLKVGVPVPLSGPYADEGREQKQGAELAVKHLNGLGDGGLLNTMQPSSLLGDGVLGQQVELVAVDSESNNGIADRTARRLLGEENVSVLVGGSTENTALIYSSVCEQFGAAYLSGMAHEINITGRFRRSLVFRQYLNSSISGITLGEGMVRELGSNRTAYMLVSAGRWGGITSSAFRQTTERLGWRTVATRDVELSAGSYLNDLNAFISSGADVLVLALQGLDMVNALSQVRQLGIHDMQANGLEIGLGVPVYSTHWAEAAGAGCKGVYGTMNWHWSLQDPASIAFTGAYESEYDAKPSEAAHTVYTQILQYADAAQRAGSISPCHVVEQLEGHVFSGLGNGASEYRKVDHQCFKDTIVVAGRQAPATSSDLLEIKQTIAKDDTKYDPDNYEFIGLLGDCPV